MTLVSFPAAAADPSEIGLTDPRRPAATRYRHAPPVTASWPVLIPIAPPRTTIDDASDARVAAGVLPDELIALARAAAVEEAGRAEAVGDYLGAVAEDDVAVSGRVRRDGPRLPRLVLVGDARRGRTGPARRSARSCCCRASGRCWRPPWVPWDQRIRAGDVGAGDLLPTAPDDDPPGARLRRFRRPGGEGGRVRVRLRPAPGARAAKVGTTPRSAGMTDRSGRTTPIAQAGPGALRHLRVLRPAARIAGHGARRLRQRVLAGRRSGGGRRVRLRRAFADRDRRAADLGQYGRPWSTS